MLGRRGPGCQGRSVPERPTGPLSPKCVFVPFAPPGRAPAPPAAGAQPAGAHEHGPRAVCSERFHSPRGGPAVLPALPGHQHYAPLSARVAHAGRRCVGRTRAADGATGPSSHSRRGRVPSPHTDRVGPRVRRLRGWRRCPRSTCRGAPLTCVSPGAGGPPPGPRAREQSAGRHPGRRQKPRG